MKHEAVQPRRRATNVTLPEELVLRARRVDVNVSRACAAGLAAAVQAAETRRWEESHRERIDAFTTWLDEHGMPFEDLRVF